MTLKRAFAQSVNSIAVKLGQEMGIGKVAATAHAMGIKSKLDETPSLALGSSDVSLLELVNAYTTVANDGKAHDPVLVTAIYDRDGNRAYFHIGLPSADDTNEIHRVLEEALNKPTYTGSFVVGKDTITVQNAHYEP
jgi:membrane peptidoglycan carboxypeptidase